VIPTTATLEAAAGQLYVTILIAALVASYISQRNQPEEAE